MSSLADQSCTACRTGAAPATAEEIATKLSQLTGWHLVNVDGIQRLQKVYSFKNFAQALRFTDMVGEVAEQANHHPAILTEWGQVTVTWWTHVIAGLHANDFIMAAKTDEVIRTAGLAD